MKNLFQTNRMMAILFIIAALVGLQNATSATLTITSPNGGEELVAGTTATINWITDTTGNARIVLLKDGVQVRLIAAGTLNDGSHEWLIPESIVSGADYTIQISSCLIPELVDVSDGNFSITGGAGGSTVLVISPNGGELLTAGTLATITWESDVTGDVRISLLKDGVHAGLITLGTPNDGSFDWMIPAGVAPGELYTIKVASVSNVYVFDVSDNNFSIVEGSGYAVTVLSPNGGELLGIGSTSTITWESNFTGFLRITLLKGGEDYATISYKTPNTGSFNWVISDIIEPGNNYSVRIASCFNSSIVDYSDADFEIAEVEFLASNYDFKTGNIAPGEPDNSNIPVINLYPNPAVENLNITTNGNIQHVWLMNSLGQLVFESQANASQIQLNVEAYKADLYFVRIEIDGIIKTQKVYIK